MGPIVLDALAAADRRWMVRGTPVNPVGIIVNDDARAADLLALLANWGPCP